MFSFIKQHKIVSLVVFLNVVALLIIVLVIVIQNMKTASVDIMVTPINATVELNGKKYENFETSNIAPGRYTVKISMEGMQTKEYGIELMDGGFERIWTYLLDDNGGFDYYMNHPDDATILSDIADSNVRNFLADYNKLTSIKDVLPLQLSNTFDENATEIISVSVRWGAEDECNEKAYCLIIHDLTGKNTEKALQLIRDAGFNPNDYELVYEEGEGA